MGLLWWVGWSIVSGFFGWGGGGGGISCETRRNVARIILTLHQAGVFTVEIKI